MSNGKFWPSLCVHSSTVIRSRVMQDLQGDETMLGVATCSVRHILIYDVIVDKALNKLTGH